jgi:hypothetical protein
VIHTAALVHRVPTVFSEYKAGVGVQGHIERDIFHRPRTDGWN